MNAIDQYVAPAPTRPSAPPAQAPRAASDSSDGPTFGDVYNKAANSNQQDDHPAAASEANGSAATPQTKVEDKAAPTDAKQGTTQPDAASSLFPSSLEADPRKQAKSGKAAAGQQGSGEPAENSADAKSKQVFKDAVALPEDANSKDATAQAQTTATESDAAVIALKLLGADGTQEKRPVAKSTNEKEDPAKDKKDDPESDNAVAAPDAASTLMAASLAVNAAGGQSKDPQPQQQEKSKPDEKSSSKAVASTGLQIQGSSAGDDLGKKSTGDDAVKPESVTVLDARRFVGSGETVSANTLAVLSGVKGSDDWAAAMKAASNAANATSETRTATPVNTLKIQMTPESLGNVTATLRLHGDQLTVHLSVESGEAFKQLSQDKDGLIQSLKSQGFSVDQVSVQMAPTPATDKSVVQTSSGQQTGGQMQDGSSAGQFAQQGREQDNNRRQQDNGFNANWQGDDKKVVTDPVASPSDTARSGQVYL